jgi:hypothetical protein
MSATTNWPGDNELVDVERAVPLAMFCAGIITRQQFDAYVHALEELAEHNARAARRQPWFKRFRFYSPG